MAWNEINYSCGHSDRVQLYGPGRDRESRKAWLERGVCPDCYRAQKDRERQQENDRAAKLTSEIGFAALAGSEKQTSWAQSIRQKAYENICANHQPHKTHGWSLVVELLNAETSAKWWIDNRTNSGMMILKLIGANHPAKLAEMKGREQAA